MPTSYIFVTFTKIVWTYEGYFTEGSMFSLSIIGTPSALPRQKRSRGIALAISESQSSIMGPS